MFNAYVVFLQVCYFSGEDFNSRKKFHGTLKACKIFSCVKNKCRIFMKAALV